MAKQTTKKQIIGCVLTRGALISKSAVIFIMLALLFTSQVNAQQNNGFLTESNTFQSEGQTKKENSFRYPQLFINDLHDGSLRYDNSYTDFIFLAVQDSPFQTIPGIDYESAEFFQFLFAPTSLNAWATLNMSVYHLQDRSQIVQCKMKPGMPIGQCRVNKQKVDKNQKLLIKIQAQYQSDDAKSLGQIKYQFRANWQIVSQITVNNQYQLDFTNMTVSPQYHVTIPNQQFTELRITLVPQTHQQNYDNVKIYGRFGAEIQPTDSFHDFQSIHLWNGGQGIFLMKNQIKQSKKISLLIEAVSNTVYKLNIELIKGISHQIDLNQILYEHLMPNSVRIYHVILPKVVNASKESDYIISVLQQAGSLMIENYKDEKLTQKFEKQPYSYKKDSKILIASDQQQKLREFYMRVESGDHDSIFMVNFNERDKQTALKLTQGVAQNLEVITDQIIYIEYQKYYQTDEEASSINIQILKVFGKIEVEFRICNPQNLISDCLNKISYKNSSLPIQHYDSSFVGLKNFYKFNISDQKMITDVQHHQKLGYLLIRLVNINQNAKTNTSMAMVEYKHNARVESIRQGKPITDIVSYQEERFYKYINTQPQITEIRFHLVQISGQTEMEGFRQDPRQKTLAQIVERQKELENNKVPNKGQNPLIFTKDLEKPIYIRITGRSQAVFGLSIQLKHNTEQFVSTITLEEQVKFKVQIKPGEAEVFSAHALFGSLYFSYKASGIIMICSINKQNACENGLPTINSGGVIDNKFLRSTQSRIRISNPSDKKIVQVEVQFRSEDYNKCQVMKTGQLIHKVIKNGECFDYGLDTSDQDLEIFTERVDFGQLHAHYKICGSNYTVPSTKRKFIIEKKQLQQLCKGRKGTDKDLVIGLSSSVSTQKTIKIQSLVQYKNKIMTLPDGIAYRTQAKTFEDATGVYFYDFLNMVDTRIILRSIRGRCLFYVNVYEKNKRNNTSRKIVSKTQFDFMPQSPDYLADQYLHIKAADLKAKCKTKCSMDIAVYSKQTVGTQVQYSIEVVQNYNKIRDHKPLSMHLLKDSSAFYQYRFSQSHQNSSLIIELSDDNLQCASTFVSQNDVPSEHNNIGKSQGNKLVLSENVFTDKIRKQKTYYIGVYAKEDCSYTLTVYSTKVQIVTLQRGKSHDINLEKSQVKYFMFEHLSEVGFKIVSMSQYGKVRIYADRLSEKAQDSKVKQSGYMVALKQNKTIDYLKFAFKGNQYNLLAINNKDKGFCSNCYYILAVQATEKTRSSIMLADKETPVHITPSKQFYDEMKGKDQTSSLQLIMVKTGKLEIVVFYGTLQFTVKDSNVSKKSGPLSYSNSVQYFDFDFSNSNKKFWQTLKIEAKCTTDSCAYSLKVQLIDSKPKNTTKDQNGKVVQVNVVEHVIKKGHPTFLSIGINKVQCFSSFIKGKDDQFIISANRRMVQPLSELNFSVKIGTEQNVEIAKNVIRNSISVGFKPKQEIEGVQPIDFCVKLPTNKFFSGMIEHADEETSLLPTDYEVAVQKQKIFTIYPQGSFIMDLFQCQGQAVILQGNSQQLLAADRSKMSALNNLGMPGQPHAIKMTGYSTTLIKISSPLALVRWFPINEVQNRGLGYVSYKVGEIQYDTEGQWIKFEFDTLKINKQENKKYLEGTEVEQLKYYMYVSNRSEHLKSATQCQRYRESDVIMLDLQKVIDKEQLVNGKAHVSLPKADILKFFKLQDNIFFSVGAFLRLKIKDLNTTRQINIDPSYEDYKFIYAYKQIPSDVWKNLEKESFNLILMIALIVAAVVGLFVFTIVLIKCLIPMISRIRNSNLVEQKADPKDGSEIIPPSSERNRVNDRRVADDLVISQRQKETA